ncbi:MAG: phosphatase PAP2 family protein [Flavitalea sp.]
MIITKRILSFFIVVLFANVVLAQNWETRTLMKINPSDPSSKFLRGITNSTYVISAAAPVAVLITGFAKDDPALKRKALVMIAGTVIQAGATTILKDIVKRDRPAETHPTLIFPYEDKNGKSFPSGHTGFAFATATSLTLQFPKWYVAAPAFAWAGAVGYSRMYLGVHYPGDIAAGAVVGAGSAFLAHWLNRKLFPEPKSVAVIGL